MPPAEEDWLLDIRLYSAQFHADVASLWLQELGSEQPLFARSPEGAGDLSWAVRTAARSWAAHRRDEDDEAALDLKMMAVLVAARWRARSRCSAPYAMATSRTAAST